MRSRNEHVQLWLNRKEAATLARRAKACGITQSAYLRHLIMGFVPREQPSPDYYAFMRSLYSLANNLNQIAQKAHVLNVIDAQRYDRYARMTEDLVREITRAMIEPRKMTQEEREVLRNAEKDKRSQSSDERG